MAHLRSSTFSSSAEGLSAPAVFQGLAHLPRLVWEMAPTPISPASDAAQTGGCNCNGLGCAWGAEMLFRRGDKRT